MKKFVAVVATVALSATMLAGTAFAAAKTGTGTAKGIGDVKVTLTVDGGKITKVDIDASGETPAIGGKAAETLKAEMLKKNTIKPDDISGATVTCKAVREAAAAALKATGQTLK